MRTVLLLFLVTLPLLAAPPAFRENYKSTDWSKRLDDAIADIGDLDGLATSPHPMAGALIRGLDDTDKSQARKLHLKPGQIITEVDGEPILQRNLNELRKDEPQEITVVDPGGKVRKLKVEPGLLGIYDVRYFRPELFYLREGHRDPRWDQFAAIGARYCFSQPDLAETAWFHALQAGYVPDSFSDYCGANIAWRQARNVQALQFLGSLTARENNPPVLAVQELSYELSVANLRMDRAIASLPVGPVRGEDHREQFTEYFKSLQAYVAQEGPGPRHLNPREAATKYGTESLVKDMEFVRDRRQRFNKWLHETSTRISNGKMITMDAETDRFGQLIEAPKHDASEVELVVKVILHHVDRDPGDYEKMLQIGLVPCDEPVENEENPPAILAAFITDLGICTVNQKTENDDLMVQALSVAEQTPLHKEFTMRLLHTIGRDEVWLNSRRLLLLPSLNNPKRLGFYLQITGMKADLHVDYSRIKGEAK